MQTPRLMETDLRAGDVAQPHRSPSLSPVRYTGGLVALRFGANPISRVPAPVCLPRSAASTGRSTSPAAWPCANSISIVAAPTLIADALTGRRGGVEPGVRRRRRHPVFHEVF